MDIDSNSVVLSKSCIAEKTSFRVILHLLGLAFPFILKSIKNQVIIKLLKFCTVDRNDGFFAPLFAAVGCPFMKARSGAAPWRVKQMVPVYPAAGHTWVEKLCKTAECGT